MITHTRDGRDAPPLTKPSYSVENKDQIYSGVEQKVDRSRPNVSYLQELSAGRRSLRPLWRERTRALVSRMIQWISFQQNLLPSEAPPPLAHRCRLTSSFLISVNCVLIRAATNDRLHCQLIRKIPENNKRSFPQPQVCCVRLQSLQR